MDRYAAMHCFCRVVETGSFAAAARDLDCSRSVVTKHVQSLEDWTGTRLLERTTRTMQLTEAGARFHAFCRRVLEDTEATLGELREDKLGLHGRLVVSCPVSLGQSFLAEHLHAFQQQHPQVDLEVQLAEGARSVDGVTVDVRRVPELVPIAAAQAALQDRAIGASG